MTENFANQAYSQHQQVPFEQQQTGDDLNDRAAASQSRQLPPASSEGGYQQRGPASYAQYGGDQQNLQYEPQYQSYPNYAVDADLLSQPGGMSPPPGQPLPQANEDFLLMDVVGGGCTASGVSSRSVAVLHPTKPIVAYTAGCMIIVYDLMGDSKVNLVGHQHDIHALVFTPSGDHLLSVDFNRNAELQDNLSLQGGRTQESTCSIILWDWQRGQSMQDADIPRSQNLTMIIPPGQTVAQQQDTLYSQFQASLGGGAPNQQGTCHIQISFEKSGTMFMILESSPLEIGGGYRVTLWSFNKQQIIEMISSMDLELQNPCFDLRFLPRGQSDILFAQRSAAQSSHSAQVFLNSKLPFLTAEKQCLKMWEYSQGNAHLKKRIHIKQNIVALEVSELTNFFLILSESGRVLILDQQGEFVSTLSRDGVFFTRLGAAHDKLLLGTNRGTVHVYHMASLQFISEIPFQLSFLDRFSLNSLAKNTLETERLSLDKIGPPVSQIATTLNLRFLWIRYQDGSFVVIDRTIMNPRQAVLGYSCGHFEKVSGMQWILPRSSIDLVSRAGGFGNLNNLSLNGMFATELALGQSSNQGAVMNQQFVTCSHDLSIHVWRHYGDRWAFSYIDVAKSFDQALSFQRKQCDRSTREMQLTAICLYPRSNNIVVGDSKGFVRVFQLVNESSHLLATYRLPRSKEIRAERGLGIDSTNAERSRLGVDEDFTNDQITEIYITKHELIAVVTFQSGVISLYDIKNGYQWVGDAVDQDYYKFNTQFANSNFLAIQTRIIEVNQSSSAAGSRLNSSTFAQGLGQDEQPFSMSGTGGFLDPVAQARRQAGSRSSHMLGSHTASLKILSLQTPNQVSMQLVDVKGSKLTRSPLCNYIISEGKVTGFALHPSEDYLLVTSSKGRIYVFRIDTGELRGTIRIPLNASGCETDPSGLYVIVKVPAFSNHNAQSLAQGGQGDFGHFVANEKDLSRNTILMYEIGTGLPAAEICSVFEVTQMKFSSDGRYLSLGSSSGAISVWSMGSHLLSNVKQVLDAMTLSGDFWFNYPIFLPDYEQFHSINPEPVSIQQPQPEFEDMSPSQYQRYQQRPPAAQSDFNYDAGSRAMQSQQQQYQRQPSPPRQEEYVQDTAAVAQEKPLDQKEQVELSSGPRPGEQSQPQLASNRQQFASVSNISPAQPQPQILQSNASQQQEIPQSQIIPPQFQPQTMAPPAYHPPNANMHTLQGNEQRFLRTNFSYGAPNPGGLGVAPPGDIPSYHLRQQQLHQTPQFQQQEQQNFRTILSKQRTHNNSLYASQRVPDVSPPNYPSVGSSRLHGYQRGGQTPPHPDLAPIPQYAPVYGQQPPTLESYQAQRPPSMQFNQLTAAATLLGIEPTPVRDEAAQVSSNLHQSDKAHLEDISVPAAGTSLGGRSVRRMVSSQRSQPVQSQGNDLTGNKSGHPADVSVPSVAKNTTIDAETKALPSAFRGLQGPNTQHTQHYKFEGTLNDRDLGASMSLQERPVVEAQLRDTLNPIQDFPQARVEEATIPQIDSSIKKISQAAQQDPMHQMTKSEQIQIRNINNNFTPLFQGDPQPNDQNLPVMTSASEIMQDVDQINSKLRDFTPRNQFGESVNQNPSQISHLYQRQTPNQPHMDVPPTGANMGGGFRQSDNTSSVKQGPPSEVVEDLYNSIDEFENKLQLLQAQYQQRQMQKPGGAQPQPAVIQTASSLYGPKPGAQVAQPPPAQVQQPPLQQQVQANPQQVNAQPPAPVAEVQQQQPPPQKQEQQQQPQPEQQVAAPAQEAAPQQQQQPPPAEQQQQEAPKQPEEVKQ